MSETRARSVSDAKATISTKKNLKIQAQTSESCPTSAVDEYPNDEPTTPQGLKRYSAFENLNEKIAHRPSKSELLNRNILRDDKVSPALQAAQQDLKKRKIEDSLNHKIGKRTAIDKLVEQNIIFDPNVASSIQSAQKDLKRSLREAELSRHLKERQPKEELIKKHIIQDSSTTLNES